LTRQLAGGLAFRPVAKSLACAGRNRKLIYFGPAFARAHDTLLTFISIEDVFARMMKGNRTLIEKMLKTDWANNGALAK
jgi:hypothetical protein